MYFSITVNNIEAQYEYTVLNSTRNTYTYVIFNMREPMDHKPLELLTQRTKNLLQSNKHTTFMYLRSILYIKSG